MLDAVATPHERIVIWLLRWTGLRIGEACALTVADVDLERDEIRVRESKTASGLRTVSDRRAGAQGRDPVLAAET